MRVFPLFSLLLLALCGLPASATDTSVAQTDLNLLSSNSLPKHDGHIAWGLFNHGAQLVDVRTPAEFQAEFIAEAENIPLSDLPGRLSELSRDFPVIVYCRSGNRSGQASAFLRANGFQVYDAGMYRVMAQAKKAR